MGLMRRKRPSSSRKGKKSGVEEAVPHSSDKMNDSLQSKESLDFAEAFDKKDLNKKAQEVMKTDLDLMKDIVMQIREDEDFAASIYDDCPRLQHMLDQHPDLRPVFEDPKLVRINFEQVYRDAGGVLPEDPPPRFQKVKKCIAVIVNHPLFKIVRALLIVKKIFTCITGGGVSLVRNCFRATCGAFCCSEGLDMIDGDIDGEGSPENRANREALNKAADHMEQPEVQEKMSEILAQEDPAALEEAIENDKDLKALRDSNPLCSELMSDPETMGILTEPDNLRALGEAPDLIQADFADPDWVSPDDIEARGGFMETVPEEGPDGDYDLDFEDGDDVNFDFDFEGDAEAIEPDAEAEAGEGRELELAGEEEGDFAEDFEMGESEDNNNAKGKGSKSRGQQKKQNEGKKREGGNFMSNFAAGLTDYVAGELVGATLGDLTGGGDELAGLENLDAVEDVPVEDIADAAETGGDAVAETAVGVASAADAVEAITEGDALDNLDTLEEQMDMAEEHHENVEREEEERRAATAAGGGAAVGVAGGAAFASRSMGDDEESEEEAGNEEPKKKNRFGFIGTGLSAISSAAKEHVAATLLGDDVGEMFLEKVEGDDEDETENEDDDDRDSKRRPKR